ncbi:transferrin receptor-like dimerization domain-containing protein [Granulicella arctica]|uniref:transferrin receptor-like dimerization domain-containing protein n=1 Tax=Granulicella arctica TaxID=940613 RepID=UPI0021E0F48C|nr:transferrin receptor-like dimerization domain-containing protein [Granulicella arctica]
MRRTVAVALTLGLSSLLLAQETSTPALLGFSAATSSTEQQWEKKFRALPEAKRIHDNMEHLAAHPHHVGSPYQRKNAEWVMSQYKSWGWDAHIEQFDVLFPTPKERVIELLGPTPYKAKLDEPPLPGDPYTKDRADQLPGYNIYSADGDVTAPLIYANFGLPADYEELRRNGISVKGAIVITRYGGGWRGLKPKLAYEQGAVGCIIYSDPLDDGYGKGDVLPKGPMRNADGIQRGSVSDTTMFAGDPLTPGIGSVPGAKRLKIEDSPVIMKIPVLPIGYGDALPLLSSLDGRVVPAAWRGALPITYHFGPGTAKVHLKATFNWDTRPVLDVIATMKGSEEPDVWIVRGNHYDGWVNGADDPISGQAALLEEARSLGELAKQGWKPKRTLIYAAWDGEEPGLIGSTEWAETHADELNKHAALYINSDENNRGFFNAGGSHALEQVINDVAKDITDPETKTSIWKRQQAARLMGGRGAATEGGASRADVLKRATLSLGAIGSGSDFATFIDHLGIASVNLGFGGEDSSGTYHSAYDTPWFIEHFGDKDALYGPTMAQTAGTLVMRVADADVLPYDFTILTETVRGYSTELKALIKTMQRDAATQKRNMDLGLYALMADPQKPMELPVTLTSPPDYDFTALDASIASLDKAATHFHEAEAGMITLTPEARKSLNAHLALSERKLTSEAGLPRRPWVKHVLYAPGVYTGYGAKTMPGIREAIEEGRYDEAKQQMTIVTKALNDEAAYVEGIASSAK